MIIKLIEYSALHDSCLLTKIFDNVKRWQRMILIIFIINLSVMARQTGNMVWLRSFGPMEPKHRRMIHTESIFTNQQRTRQARTESTFWKVLM